MMETTSATTTSTLTRRTALTALALALVAILLTGIAATPAGATPRQQGVSDANDFISRCMAGGGVPTVIMDSTGESLTVACTFDDYTLVCTYLPVNTGCIVMYGRVKIPAGSRIVTGPIVTAVSTNATTGPTSQVSGSGSARSSVSRALPTSDDDRR